MAEEKKVKKNKKKKKWLRPVIILAVIAAVVLFFVIRGKDAGAGYTPETAQLRDIKTYHSFTGTIAPVTEENVMPPMTTSSQVKEIAVEEGDQVKKGDLLMQLDTSTLEESIKELQASMDTASRQNALSVQDAQKAFNDYKANMDDSLNSSVIGAQQALDSAYAQLVTAQKSYNNEVKLNNAGLSGTVLSAISGVDSAYGSVRSAEIANDTANSKASGAALDAARSGYSDAVQSYEAAKIGEENTLTGLYDTLITAQTSYLDALDSYNATMRSADQTLSTYALKVEEAQAAADSTVNELKLADLKRQLSDCTITAPIDGYVTKLVVKKGDMTAAGTSLATVTSFDKMKVDIKINEYDILGVKEGKKVDIDVDALNKTYQGTIAKIAKVATVDNGVSYFKSEVDFQADEDTRSGMSVEVKLNINDLSKVVTVSTDAISTEKDGTAYVNVYAADGKTVTQQKVTCGATNGTYTQITDGLKEGDTVLKKVTVTNMMMGGGDGGQETQQNGTGE